ncbi:FAD-dependent oxidoreductase [Kitasatospora sp. NPDC049285]|uniref:FAD-binding oxidoreductase n=1 Tax=Kitasatospora sp. NPDC049285 TaxID=3157096 RepID=UPI0034421C78
MFDTSSAPLSEHSGYRRSAGSYHLVHPTSGAEVSDAVLAARAAGLGVRVRGNACAMNGTNIPLPGELLIPTTALDGYHFAAEGTITVGGGATVLNVNSLLNSLGYTLRMHNEGGPAATVGGYLSAGGVGPGAEQYGGFWEQVTEVVLVTGTGEPITVRPGDELFRWLFGSMGQLGIAVRLTLTIAPREGATPVYPLGRTGRIEPRVPDTPKRVWLETYVPAECAAEARMALRRIGMPYRHLWQPRLATFERRIRFVSFTPPLLSAHRGDLALVGEWGDLPEHPDWQALRGLSREISTWTGSDHRFRRYASADLVFEDFDYRSHYGEATLRDFAALKRRFDPDGILVRGPLSRALASA